MPAGEVRRCIYGHRTDVEPEARHGVARSINNRWSQWCSMPPSISISTFSHFHTPDTFVRHLTTPRIEPFTGRVAASAAGAFVLVSRPTKVAMTPLELIL